MTDTERERINAICEIAGVSDIEDLSDGFHTFAQLYYQRMILSAVIVKQNKNKSWKSLRHENGELCFGGGWFIVGIDTPEGSYTYHYETKYFDLFDCEIIDYGKHWDGHTEKDVTRLLALPSAQQDVTDTNVGDMINRQAAISRAVTITMFGRDIRVVGVSELESLPSAQPEQRWIPCSERLPEIKEYYVSDVCIVYCENGAYGFAELEENIFGQVGWNCERDDEYHEPLGNVLAWMPLPEPYEGEE